MLFPILKKKSTKSSKNFCIFFPLFSQFPLIHLMLVNSVHLVVKNKGAGDPQPNPAAFPASLALSSEVNVPWDVCHVLVPSRHLVTASDSSCSNSFTNQQRLPCSRMPQGRIRLSAAGQAPSQSQTALTHPAPPPPPEEESGSSSSGHL